MTGSHAESRHTDAIPLFKWRGQVKRHERHLVRARREERGIEKLSIEGLV